MSYDDFLGKEEEHYYDGEPHTFNRLWMGLLASLLMPVVFLFVFLYFSQAMSFDSVKQVANYIMTNDSAFMTNMFVMALMPNMFGFFWAYKTERWKFGRGFIVGTLLFFCIYIIKASL